MDYNQIPSPDEQENNQAETNKELVSHLSELSKYAMELQGDLIQAQIMISALHRILRRQDQNFAINVAISNWLDKYTDGILTRFPRIPPKDFT
jgi:hypothetical protein